MDTKDLKIAVAGTGYVGLSIATLLSQHHQVTAVDVIPEKVDMLNRKQSPIQDEYIEKYLSEKTLNLTATLDGAKAYSDADFVVIAAPTNYDPVKNYFDTKRIWSFLWKSSIKRKGVGGLLIYVPVIEIVGFRLIGQNTMPVIWLFDMFVKGQF